MSIYEETYNQFYKVEKQQGIVAVKLPTQGNLKPEHRLFQKLADELDLNALKATQTSSKKAQARLFKRLVDAIEVWDYTNSDKLMNALVVLDQTQNTVARQLFIDMMGDYLFDLIPGYCIDGQHMNLHTFKNIDLSAGLVEPDSQKSQHQSIAFDYFYRAIFQTLALVA